MIIKLHNLFKIIALTLLIGIFPFDQTANACNWSARNPNFQTWDSCNTVNNVKKSSLSGYVSFNTNNASCFKYTWKINGNIVAYGQTFNYNVPQNGTYTICLNVLDTCNKCDTNLCVNKNISCLNSCNWKSRNPYTYSWDTCKGTGARNSVNAYISFNYNSAGCLKYQWSVNNSNMSGAQSNSINYLVSQNGTYNLCVKVTDTCNKCDTTFCISKTVSCFGNSCNWKNRSLATGFTDSCYNGAYNTLTAYANFNYSGKSCFRYSWKVNGVTINNSNSYYIQYNAYTNGTYNLCMNVRDTCNNCDTTICFSKTITCLNSNQCAWYKRQMYFSAWDSCSGIGKKYSINGYIGPQNSCYKYSWTVNGIVVSDSRFLNYAISKNGTYNLCMKVTDTCDKCDTSFCKTFNFTCITTNCNWKNRSLATGFADSCYNGTYNILSAYANFNYSGKSCFKYTWKVNGVTINNANSYFIQYNAYGNGTYNLCVNVRDTCNNCDTSICFSKTITCLGNKCAWYKRQISYNTWDSCKGLRYMSSINGSLNTQNNCYKVQWLVNNVVVSNDRNLCYQVPKNGYYTLCMKVIDTCDKCDTTYCRGFNINCFPSCNWKSRNPYTYSWDTCKGNGAQNSVNAYISFNNNTSCFKYQWTVNNTIVKGAISNILYYPIHNNGTYNLCVKVTDTCNHCDTTFCMSKSISCFKSCNWKNRIYTINFFDSCGGTNYLNSANGYVVMNQNGNNSCVKYRWKIDNNIVSYTYYFSAPIYSNGNHSYCLTLTDTCMNCDTSICYTRNYHCSNLGIDQTERTSIDIYPNPANDFIHLNSTSSFETVEITDIRGQVIWSGSVHEGENLIDISALSKGLYLLRMRNEHESITEKIMKE